MKTKLFLFIAMLGFYSITQAQVANEVLGTTVVVDGVTYTAGGSLSSGDNNTLIGDGSGSSLNTGSDNTMVGTGTGINLTNAGDCTFIGKDAGQSVTTAYDNTFIGTASGFSTTTGADNTFMGEESGRTNTIGSNNTFIGENSGYSNTEGNSNTFLGSITGQNNTTGSGNTFIGAENGIQGVIDTALGNTNDYDLDTFTNRGSGYNNTTGQANSFVGAGSGHQNIEGLANTFMGYNSGSRNRTGDLNTFIGYGSGWNNDSSVITAGGIANRNTYLGAIAGSRNVSGSDNVGIGHNANFLSITGADRNVFLGAETKVRGTDNIVIGFGASTNTSVNRTGQIIMGSNSTATQNNAIVIGNNITATRANTLTLGGNTNANRVSVGIGTVTANDNASLELGDIDKGLLLNRMTTTQRNALATIGSDGTSATAFNIAEKGTLVYDTTLDAMFTWNGSSWDGIGVNTDEQTLSLSSNTLSISGSAATVDLSSYVNTDSQELSLSSNTLSLTGSAATIDLSGYVSTDDQNLTSATLAATNILTVEIEGGTAVTVDLNPLISDLEQENDNQQIQINDLITRITTLEACACGGTLSVNDFGDDLEENQNKISGPILYQNIPNPFNGTTSIKYFVPLDYTSAAIVFSNTTGQVIDNVPLKTLGDQEIFFNSESLQSGMYYYTLFANGRKIDTKKMIIE